MKLTDTAVDRIKPKSKRQEIPDALAVGLYLVVQPSGRKGWQVRYRTPTVQRRMTLGAYPLIGLKEARIRARDILLAAHDGADPAAEAKAAKSKSAELNDRDKVSVLVEQFRKRHLADLKSGKAAYRFLERFVLPAWGDRDIQNVSKRDVIDLLDGIADSGRGVTANRVLAHTRKFFNWAVSRDILSFAPTLGVQPPVVEKSRDRVLNDDEVRWLWAACEQVGEPWGPLAKMLLLTGQRLNEVAKMTDAEIGDGVWHLAKERTKNKRAHDVPLSQAAQAVLDAKIRVLSADGYIFTTNGKTPVGGFFQALKRLSVVMEAIATKETGHAIEIPHWTFHDLRRTAATGMARLGIPVRTTEATLNHVSGTGGGIVAVYQRHDYADEKREALEAWGSYVVSLTEGGTDNVIRLEAGR
jgi:integrase